MVLFLSGRTGDPMAMVYTPHGDVDVDVRPAHRSRLVTSNF